MAAAAAAGEPDMVTTVAITTLSQKGVIITTASPLAATALTQIQPQPKRKL